MRTRKKLALVAAVATAGLLLAACGDDDDNADPTTTEAPASSAAPATTAPETDEAKDIVDTAVAAGDFTTLATALEAAGLVETLKGEGPFTVFAPTDEAFAKVPKATLDALLADKEALTRVLTYHVLAGKVMAADVAAGPVEMVSGDEATITVGGSTVKINDATVTATDIEAGNGVIHVIDTVILPPGLTVG